jgi:hypothetical protein
MKILIAIQACHRLQEWKDAQRDTWMRAQASADVRIFVGRWMPLNFEDQVRRARRTGKPYTVPTPPAKQADEVWLDVEDWFHSLCEKAEAIIRWALEHEYDFMFKCDDDAYVHIPRLLASGFENFDYVGRAITNNWHGFTAHYAQGGAGCWMSRKAMKAFLEHAEAAAPFLNCEDIRTGRALERAGIHLENDDRYEPYLAAQRAPRPDNSLISTHKCRPEVMRAIHQVFK